MVQRHDLAREDSESSIFVVPISCFPETPQLIEYGLGV